jgi:NAD(P)-dependent dehydrogenase (short-subunit alcohol dehydrogenase family)
VLRDKTFAKMDMADLEFVVRVHLIGSANCSKAVWNGMRERNYGRIVLTSSASGVYGNFGQANYGAAKAAMIGLMNVLHLEGAKNDIRVNTLAPTARTAMTEGLLSVTRNRKRTPVMIRLRLQMLAPLSMRCSWKRRTSSAVAVSGERLSQAANRLQLEIWLRCVCGLSLRAAMSSIIR